MGNVWKANPGVVIPAFLLFLLSGLQSAVAGDSDKGQAYFADNCAACHTIGESDGSVPDLKGVTSRRSEEWLKSFIQSPSQMAAKKDPATLQLIEKYGAGMDDSGITDEDALDVIEYLKTTVSSQLVTQPVQVANKEETKKAPAIADISKGRALFLGEQRFLHKGPACISCHDIKGSPLLGGGVLAKPITTARSGTAAVLRKPPFPVMREAYANKELADDEIHALVEFLGDLGKAPESPSRKGVRFKMLTMGFIGLGVLFLVYGLSWQRGRRIRKE